MTDKQLGLLLIAPLIIGTGILLWRQGALGFKALLLAIMSTLVVASFLFFTLEG
jgi:hypothetical protein